MSKPVIGIISNRSEGENGRPFTRTTNFSNIIAEKLYYFDAIPMGIIFPYGVYDNEAMNQCDGFIFQGGSKIELCQILAMKYVFDTKKPVLGICNGMQTMAGYDYIMQNVDNPTDINIYNFYNQFGEDGFLYKVSGHNKENPFYIQNYKNATHNVIFNGDDNYFTDYYGTNIINALSLHNYAVKHSVLENSNLLKIAGESDDNVIEAIQAIDPCHCAFGVQYHIEITQQGDFIFRDLVEDANYQRKLKR